VLRRLAAEPASARSAACSTAEGAAQWSARSQSSEGNVVAATIASARRTCWRGTVQPCRVSASSSRIGKMERIGMRR
jgi:hypothetical protein